MVHILDGLVQFGHRTLGIPSYGHRLRFSLHLLSLVAGTTLYLPTWQVVDSICQTKLILALYFFLQKAPKIISPLLSSPSSSVSPKSSIPLPPVRPSRSSPAGPGSSPSAELPPYTPPTQAPAALPSSYASPMAVTNPSRSFRRGPVPRRRPSCIRPRHLRGFLFTVTDE